MYAPRRTSPPSSSNLQPGSLPTLPRRPAEPADRVLVLGETTFRRAHRRFGVTSRDRLRHLYVLGKTGSGKSTLLQNLIAQDLANGTHQPPDAASVWSCTQKAKTSPDEAPGVAVLDPHGALVESVLRYVPSRRTNDVLVFDPADQARPVAFNVFRALAPRGVNTESADAALLASSLISVFKKQWASSWGPRLEHVLRNAILAVAADDEATLVLLYRFLTDGAVRDRVVGRVTDPVVRQFWTKEFAGYRPALQSEATAPVLNKLGAFVSMPRVRAIVGQVRSKVDLVSLMDRGSVVLANLNTGAVGEDAAHLLGGLLLSSIQLAAMRRARRERPFFVYIDEFQHFVTDSLATMLSESRKFGVGLTLAHQYLGQLPLGLQGAVLGNVGSSLVFRVGAEDAYVLERELFPPFCASDLTRLPNYHIAARLLAHGQQLDPFSARTLPPSPAPVEAEMRSELIRRQSRTRFGEAAPKVSAQVARTLGVEGGER